MPKYYERMEKLRRSKGLTYTYMASILGVSDRSYQRYETNDIKPSIEKIIKLAAYYDVSVDYLLGVTDNPRRKNNKEKIISMFKVDWDKVKGLSYSEKAHCIAYIEYLYEILLKSHSEGITALERELETTDDSLFKYIFSSKIQGKEPNNIIYSILMNYINSSHLSNEVYLKKIILLEFSIAVDIDTLQSKNTCLYEDVWYTLASYLGLESLEKVDTKLDILQARYNTERWV